VWQDPHDPQHEKRYFKVLFYLADGTMEVRPEYKLNDGHYHYPNLLARQLLPKGNFPGNLLLSFLTIYYASSTREKTEKNVVNFIKKR
jgi:hypothetical protein